MNREIRTINPDDRVGVTHYDSENLLPLPVGVNTNIWCVDAVLWCDTIPASRVSGAAFDLYLGDSVSQTGVTIALVLSPSGLTVTLAQFSTVIEDDQGLQTPISDIPAPLREYVPVRVLIYYGQMFVDVGGRCVAQKALARGTDLSAMKIAGVTAGSFGYSEEEQLPLSALARVSVYVGGTPESVRQAPVPAPGPM